MAVIFVVQNYLLYRFFKTLQLRFNEQWVQLGKPSLIMGNSLGNSLAVFLFLWRRKYLGLDDVQFSKQCSTVLMFSIFSTIAAFIWVAAGLCFILMTRNQS
jgi:hypothetical protein